MSNISPTQEFRGEWLDDIPIDWNQSKIKHLFSIKKEIAGELGHDVISITQRGAKLKDTESGEGQLSLDYSKYQLVSEGDFLMNHMDLLTGYVDISKFNGVTSPDYRVFTVSNDNAYSKYFLYLFQHGYKSKIFYAYGRGSSQLGRWRFPTVEFEDFYFPFPPIEEQKLISRYLDKKTSQIDSLVEKIQKKIELLKEQRTSLINHYVTKGLDPNVEMKDSGVEWIGEIPKHWILSKFGFVASLETGNTPSKSEEDLYFTENQNGFLWVKPSDLDVGFQGVSDSEVKLTFEGKEQSRVISKDSILVCCIGNTSGKCSIANCDLSTNQQINSITFKDQILPRYGLYYMDVFGRDLLKWMNFVTLPIISKGDLSQQPVIVPPKSEQIVISEILDKIISEHKFVTELHLQKIQLLKEYRQSLISSVVTGKVRVTEDMI